MRVLVIIPALNAEPSIGRVIAECRAVCEQVVVVDDGSTDGTARVAREAGADVVSHPKNRGKGAALKTAFAYALDHGFDAVVTLDADGQHLPKEIPKFVAAREQTGAHLVIGGRAHLFQEMLPRRRFANRMSSWFIARVSKTGVTDSQSGFRLYSAELLRSVHLHSDGFDLESEVIVRAGCNHFKVITIPIDLGFVDGLSTSHYKPLQDSLRIAWTVFRARWIWRK